MSSRVEMHLYDVSKGFAKNLAPAILGMEIEGLWHSGIVVNGVEYHYGPSGLWRSFPHQTFLGTPHRVTVLGQTSLAGDDLEDAVRGLVRGRYTEEQYDVLFNNGNHFANDLALVLTGSPLPDYVLNQIQDILATPIGERLVYMLPPFLFSRGQPPPSTPPQADPAAPSTSSGPAPKATGDAVMDDAAEACPKYSCPQAGNQADEEPQAEYHQYQTEYQDLDVFQLVQDVLQNLLGGAAAGPFDSEDGCAPHGFRPHHGPPHHHGPHHHGHHGPHHHGPHHHGPPHHPPHHGPPHHAPDGPPHHPPHGPPHHPPHGPPHHPPHGFGPGHPPHPFGPHPPHFGLGGFGPSGFGPGGFGLFGFGPGGLGFGPFGMAGPLRGMGPMGGCMKRRGPCGMGFGGYGGGRGRGCGRRGRGCGPCGGRGCEGMERGCYYDAEREEAQAAAAAGPSTSAPKPQASPAPTAGPSAPQYQEPHPSAPQAPAVNQAPAAEAAAAASMAAELARISVAAGDEEQAVPRGDGRQEAADAEAAASQWDVLNVEEVAGARKIE